MHETQLIEPLWHTGLREIEHRLLDGASLYRLRFTLHTIYSDVLRHSRACCVLWVHDILI